MSGAEAHVGGLVLRRLRAGELIDPERTQVTGHTEHCAHCRAKLRELDGEQRAFEEEISFERFSAGVKRAAKQPATVAIPKVRWLYPAMAAAAMVTVVVMAGPLVKLYGGEATVSARNRVKGGAGIDVRIAAGSDGPQRSASVEAPEPLGPGERVRIGYRGGVHRYVLSLSVDAKGVVTPLYPENGASLPAKMGEEMEYLPESLEFTGHGAERVFVILSDQPLEMSEVRDAAERAFEESGRDVTRMRTLEVPGEQFARTLLKP